MNAPRNNSIIASAQSTCHQSVSSADWKQAGWVGWCIGRSMHSALLPIDSGLWRAAFDFRLDYLCPAADENIAQCAIARRFEEQNIETPPSLARRQHVTFAPSAEFQYSTQYNAVRTPRSLWICMRVWQIKGRHRCRWTSKMNSLCSFLFAFKTHSHTLLDLDWANNAKATYVRRATTTHANSRSIEMGYSRKAPRISEWLFCQNSWYCILNSWKFIWESRYTSQNL